MPSYRRPLSAVLNALTEVGFNLEKVLEPKPALEFKDIDPKGFTDLSRRPGFICIRARKGTKGWANGASLETRRANEKKTTEIGRKRGKVLLTDLKKSAQEVTKDEQRKIEGGAFGSSNHPHLWTQQASVTSTSGE